MNSADGFLNVHPFFVHAPLVLIPLAAVMTWLGRKVRKDGFDTATLLITLAAALAALAAMGTGWSTKGTFPRDEALRELMEKHETNGSSSAYSHPSPHCSPLPNGAESSANEHSGCAPPS